MDSLRVRVLGALEVEGVEEAALGSRKGRTLLKVLAVARGEPVSVDRIIDACWPESPPSRPGDQVAVLVSRLRRALGRERIVRSDAGYALAADWIDLDELDDLTAEATRRLEGGSHAAARSASVAALALVRGPLAVDEDAVWADMERAAVDRVAARLHHVAAAAALAVGDLPSAADSAQAALDRDPYDEEALRLLMRAHSASGRPGSALQAYAHLRARLGEDLGADPTPETESLHTAIVRGDGGGERRPAGAARGGPAPPIAGRGSELARLGQTLSAVAPGAAAVVEISGEPGIGKTALVGAFAEEARARGSSVLLATCDELDGALPLQAVFDALAGSLRAAGSDRAAEILGDHALLLAPLLGLASGATSGSPRSQIGGPTGQIVLFRALAETVAGLGGPAPTVLVLDDAHLAAPTTIEWLRFAARHPGPNGLVVVAARRLGEGPGIAADDRLLLDPLGIEAVGAIVGADRADELWRRSGGNPLFLVELAAADEDALPESIVASVSARCEAAGEAAPTIRAAALLGPSIDLDLLATVMGLAPVHALEHVEEGVRRRLLVERGAGFAFGHDLIREAVAAEVAAPRAALVHREAARALDRRAGADPVEIARHAGLAGDDDLAADALVRAAARAAERFDYAAASQLLDRSIEQRDAGPARLERARVRILQADYEGAVDDARAAGEAGAGVAALEAEAWAAYYGRDFAAAVRAADDAVRLATTPALQAECLTIGGRTRHAAGDLAGAEAALVEATRLAGGIDLVVASAYLGVLRSHQSRFDEALDLMQSALRLGGEPARVNVVFHALMFTGHAHAMAGRPAQALELFDRFDAEVERRQVERYRDGRPHNFAAWVLRNLGCRAEADDRNAMARELSHTDGREFGETAAAAHLDLAESALWRGDPDAATSLVDRAERSLAGDLVFGWRQRLKARLMRARVALATEDFVDAVDRGAALAQDAEALGVPRYAVPARLLVARAHARAGEAVDAHAIIRDVEALERVAALESWWVAAGVAADTGLPAVGATAEAQAGRLVRQAGPWEEGLRELVATGLEAPPF